MTLSADVPFGKRCWPMLSCNIVVHTKSVSPFQISVKWFILWNTKVHFVHHWESNVALDSTAFNYMSKTPEHIFKMSYFLLHRRKKIIQVWDGPHCRTWNPRGGVGRSNSSYLPSSTPWSLIPPLNLPNSTPQIWIRLRPLDLVYCNEVLLTSLERHAFSFCFLRMCTFGHSQLHNPNLTLDGSGAFSKKTCKNYPWTLIIGLR